MFLLRVGNGLWDGPWALKKGLRVGNGPGAFEWVWANLKVDGQVKGPLIISSLDLGFISSPRLPTRRPKLIHHQIHYHEAQVFIL